MVPYFNTLGVQFIVLVGICPVESCIAFLIDKKVWEVYLFEFKIDRSNEFLCDNLRSDIAYSRSGTVNKRYKLHVPIS